MLQGRREQCEVLTIATELRNHLETSQANNIEIDNS